jgi:glutamine amidotransferase
VDVSVLDVGGGNLRRLCEALEAAGARCAPGVGRERLVLGGIGTFAEARRRLRASGAWDRVLAALDGGRPVLGIGLGMHLLFESTVEHGHHLGLGALRGQVRPLGGTRAPFVGLREVWPGQAPCWFAHAFAVPESPDEACRVDGFVAVAGRGDVLGWQFHPESSARAPPGSTSCAAG